MALSEGTNCGFVTEAPSADPSGTNTGTADTYGFAGEFAAPVNATAITEIGWWCDVATEEADFEVGLYANDGAGGIPGTRLAVAGPAAKGTTAGWKKISISCAVTGGTTYWIAAQLDNTATASKVDYSAVAGEKEEYISATSLPNPWGASSSAANRLLALYAVYTTAAGGVALAGSVSGVSTTSTLLPYIDHYLVNNTIVGQSTVSQVLPYIDHYLVNNSIIEQSSVSQVLPYIDHYLVDNAIVEQSNVSQVLPYIYHYLVDNAVAGASDLVGNLTVILAQIYQYLAGAVEAVSSLPAILPYIYHTLVNNVVEGVSDLVGNLTVIAGSVASRLRIYMRIGGGRF